MEIIDTQSHIWERPGTTTRPWDPFGLPLLDGEVDPQTQVHAMEAVGIRALLLNVMPHYRTRRADGSYLHDDSYAEEAISRHPDRLRSVPWVDPTAPDIAEILEQVCAKPAAVGVRVGYRTTEARIALAAGRDDALFAAAGRCGLPVFLALRGSVDAVAAIAPRHPSTQLVIDGLGLPAPVHRPAYGEPVFAGVPAVLRLANYPNVAIKWAGHARFSSEDYPFDDIWPHLEPLLQAFSVNRLMFGSDWTHGRGNANHHSYAECVYSIRDTVHLSNSEKKQILSGTARNLLTRLGL